VLSHANPTELLHGINSCQSAWLEDVVSSYNNNHQTQRLLQQLAIRDDPEGRFNLQEGLLRFHDRI
jgi:hypothetical protein